MLQLLRSLLGTIAVLIWSSTVVLAQSSPQDYPQWRGRNRDGAASGFSEPKAWPEKLTRRWKVEVGEGYATPIVVGQRVYAFARRDGKEALLSLDAATGKIVWQTGYTAPPLAPGSVAAKHGNGPKATPLFHNGKIYTLGLSGIFSAFDAKTGKLMWQKPAPADPPYYGMAVSPVGDKDLVIVHPGSNGPLTAFDANTGAVKWAVNGDSAWASPIIVELGGTRQVVVDDDEKRDRRRGGRWRVALGASVEVERDVEHDDSYCVRRDDHCGQSKGACDGSQTNPAR